MKNYVKFDDVYIYYNYEWQVDYINKLVCAIKYIESDYDILYATTLLDYVSEYCRFDIGTKLQLLDKIYENVIQLEP